MTEDEDFIAGIMEQVARNVREHGIHLTSVPPGGQPGFTYTTGMCELPGSVPEVLIVGLDHQLSGQILNDLYGMLDTSTLADLAPGQRVDRLISGHPTVLCPTSPWAPAFLARHYRPDVQVLQLLWPDAQSRFAWDPGCTLSPTVQGTWWLQPPA